MRHHNVVVVVIIILRSHFFTFGLSFLLYAFLRNIQMDDGDGNNSNGDGGSFRLGPDLLVKLKKGTVTK